ncbi:uncharacterized protein LOC118560226 isoform X4 [Fundulus heteroclitus]|nr:uncharacterized protein LOC118560226 isoform X4 [Fundulus heteroclitus]XP_035987023.1 uncharacterized protein LOC118560226 isoform X4 [Fundulus heteroclitus]XP_035987024.1 uncharacterized protein LOC118560226 isoform X4 [Fundulus heteroclitus]
MWWLRCEMRLFSRLFVPLGPVVDAQGQDESFHVLSHRCPLQQVGQVLPPSTRKTVNLHIRVIHGGQPAHIRIPNHSIFLMQVKRPVPGFIQGHYMFGCSHYLSIRWSRGLTVGGRRSWDRGPHPRAKELEACDCAGEAVAASAASWLLNSPWRTSEVLQRSPSAVGDAVVPGGRGGRGGAVCGVPGAGQALLHELQDLCWR